MIGLWVVSRLVLWILLLWIFMCTSFGEHMHVFFQMLNWPYIPGINHMFRDILSYFYVAGSDFLGLSLGSLHFWYWKKWVCKFSFLKLRVLVKFWCWVSLGLIERIGKHHLFPLTLWVSWFNGIGIISPWNIWKSSRLGSYWSGDSFLGMSLITNSSSLIERGLRFSNSSVNTGN